MSLFSYLYGEWGDEEETGHNYHRPKRNARLNEELRENKKSRLFEKLVEEQIEEIEKIKEKYHSEFCECIQGVYGSLRTISAEYSSSGKNAAIKACVGAMGSFRALTKKHPKRFSRKFAEEINKAYSEIHFRLYMEFEF